MRRGCISLGKTRCDECQQTVPHSERYLIVEDDDGKQTFFCIDCCLKKGYAGYKEEKKGEEILTFFTD